MRALWNIVHFYCKLELRVQPCIPQNMIHLTGHIKYYYLKCDASVIFLTFFVITFVINLKHRAMSGVNLSLKLNTIAARFILDTRKKSYFHLMCWNLIAQKIKTPDVMF